MDSIKKIFQSALAKIVAFAGFYLCDIILARWLGIDEYAEWVYYFSFTSIILWVSNFGISLTIRTVVAKQESVKKQDYYIRCGIVLRLSVSAFFTVLLFLLSRKLSVISGWPSQYPDLLFLMRAGCLLPLFMALTEYWKGVFVGSSRLGALVAMAALEYFGYTAGCIVGILLCRDIRGALAGFYFGYVISAVGGLILCGSALSGSEMSGRIINDALEIFRKALPYVMACIVAFVILEMDTVMIGLFRVGNQDQANYSIAKKIIQKAVNVNEAFIFAVLPGFALIDRENCYESVKAYKKYRNINVFITLGVGIGIGIVLTAFIPYIYGEEYKAAKYYIHALLPVYLCNGLCQYYINFLYYREKVWVVSMSYSISFVFNLVINCMLIPRMGAYGAAIGTMMACIPFLILLAISSKREWDEVYESLYGNRRGA